MSAERVQTVTVPTTTRGSYSFDKYQDPYAMALAFGSRPPIGEMNGSFSGLTLAINSFQWLLTDEDLLAQTMQPLKEALGKVRQEDQNYEAATMLASSFGEIELADRDNLGILAVFNALKHNIEEATQRKSDELYHLVRLIASMQMIIKDIDQEIEKRKAIIQEQRLADIQAHQRFRSNSVSGYLENAEIGVAGSSFSEKLVTQDEQELELLENQQNMLNALLFFLSCNL